MSEKLAVKQNAAELLDKALANRAKKNQYGIIVMSSATDPYLQIEKETQHTRILLEIILKHKFPLHIITKSDLVIRDFDLLQKINSVAILPNDLKEKLGHKLFITFSFSTTDDAKGKIFEPGATLPSIRLKALKIAVDNGFHSGVSLMPLLPYITDTKLHLDEMFQQFKNAGTKYLFPSTITLFGNEPFSSRVLTLNSIAKYFPDVFPKYQKYLTKSDSMPSFYREALGKKMKQLCAEYEFTNSLF
jgi:DNA repair photolyase